MNPYVESMTSALVGHCPTKWNNQLLFIVRLQA